MNLSVFDETLKVYFAAFAEPDRARRKALLLRCLTEEAEIWRDASPAALTRRPFGAG